MTKNRSLLAKYDIPIEQLDFDFVGKCDDARRVERILLILRSGEEGFYPELTSFAEDRLRQLNANSKLLFCDSSLLSNCDPKCANEINQLQVIV